MSAPTQSFTEALMHARNVAYVLKHSQGEAQPMIVSLNSGILENALNELERAHQSELGKAGGQPAHPSDHASDADSLSEEARSDIRRFWSGDGWTARGTP